MVTAEGGCGWRRPTGRGPAYAVEALLVEPAGRERDPADEVASADLRHAVARQLEKLNPIDREILRRRHWQGQTFNDIAQRLGLRPECVRKRHQRALERLRHNPVLAAACNGSDKRGVSS